MSPSSAHRPYATEVLACPHCDRLFPLTPAVLGKKIRCRGCQQVFHVPRDTSQVPLKADMAGPENAALSVLPPIAIAFMQDGRDVRACPACARVFAMKPGFVGKTIRCRLCKSSFRVLETWASPGRQEPPCDVASAAEAESPPPSAAVPGRKPVPPAVPPLPPAPAHTLQPTIFEDIGDLLDDLLPGEAVMSVVRPRDIPQRANAVDPLPVLVMSIAMVGFSVVLASALIQGSWGEWNRTITLNHARVDSPPSIDGNRKEERLRAQAVTPEENVSPPVTVTPKQDVFPAEASDGLERELREAFASIKRDDFAAADRALTAAAKHTRNNREARERVGRWRLFTSYARQYRGHRDKAFENGGVYELDGEVIVIIEAGPDHITYRQRGRNERVPRSELNPRVEMAIVGTWLAGGGYAVNHVLLGVRWLCVTPPDLERGRREWQTAQARGADVAHLLPILDEPFIR